MHCPRHTPSHVKSHTDGRGHMIAASAQRPAISRLWLLCCATRGASPTLDTMTPDVIQQFLACFHGRYSSPADDIRLFQLEILFWSTFLFSGKLRRRKKRTVKNAITFALARRELEGAQRAPTSCSDIIFIILDVLCGLRVLQNNTLRSC